MNDNTLKLARLRWHCRRGMLELDLLFIPFVDNVFNTLNLQEQQIFERLLERNDQELYNWLIKREPVNDKELQLIIERILNSEKSSL